MKNHFPIKFFAGLMLCGLALPGPPPEATAQPVWPYAPPPAMGPSATPSAQRNAMNEVRNQIRLVQNATRSASTMTSGAEMIWQQFQVLRNAYNNFAMTLMPQQRSFGANELSELSSGLDIIQEAFANYNEDLQAGRSSTTALNDLGRVLREASAVWLQQFNRDCSRLRVGW